MSGERAISSFEEMRSWTGKAELLGRGLGSCPFPGLGSHWLSCPPQSLETALKYCNYLFTTVFVLEAVLKLVAFGLRRFFKDR